VRRIAKIGVALVAAGAVVGLTAGPASASSGSWTSAGKAGSGTNAGGVSASGKWSKNSSYTYVKGYIKDTASDGRSAAILIRSVNRAGTWSEGLVYYNYTGAGTTARFNYYKSPKGYTSKTYVKECVGYRTNSGFKLTKCAANYKRIA
jgi:hypothetical protein